jgi:hypothetical protein
MFGGMRFDDKIRIIIHVDFIDSMNATLFHGIELRILQMNVLDVLFVPS